MVARCLLDCRGRCLKISDSAIRREPSPIATDYSCISIGDVGYIRNGRFHLLFSACRPLDGRTPGIDVPIGFEELTIRPPISSLPRLPGCLRTHTVRRVGAGLGVTASTTTCVPSLRCSSTHLKNVLPRPLEPGAHFSFELTGNRGAALVTGYKTYRKDASSEPAKFEEYTKRHYESWVAFALNRMSGNVRPILVDGFDLAKDFAMVAYSNESTSLECDMTISVPALGSASASIWGTWHASRTPHTNYGPQECVPPDERAAGSPPQPAGEGSAPNEYNQCVFVRYYTMGRRKWFLPKVIRAGAGPRDLGPGDNRGDAPPELSVHPGAESTTSDDEDPGGQWDSTTDDTGSDPDVVVHNTSHVWFLQYPLIPTLTFTFRTKSTTVGTPLRITYSR